MEYVKGGAHHWLVQRITAIILVPFVLWLVISVISLTKMDYATAREWIGSTSVSITLISLIIASFYHAQLGLQVIVEDYVHSKSLRLAILLLIKFAILVVVISVIFAVLKIALGC
ncbi:succinate dehydrogenase, hydrophobic membrane anchor protein [Candidatus Endolissoclinum faulkneri L2]|uniref:Succinate dehydrogenase hydrophobic membrane anchor subunit n=1 Tax=Candidatus Endolissoclinum faulkneri L2 TaxID=1193729 RepID=K7YQX1_9PROT|nr:succinate dehydrogenase, hydrophobic membrane anchor protein [Candidatus Endolissoclinum faulkneri]AFX98924.1 succinate dehydrogenase, hydrophobic membrane anchor protein [Candidatus Endolissoclinum faulkneri L2]